MIVMPIESVNAQFCQILLAEMVLSIHFETRRSVCKKSVVENRVGEAHLLNKWRIFLS